MNLAMKTFFQVAIAASQIITKPRYLSSREAKTRMANSVSSDFASPCASLLYAVETGTDWRFRVEISCRKAEGMP